MKILNSLVFIAGILIICDFTTTIIGLNMGFVEINLITNIFLIQFGTIPGLIIAAIVKFSLIITPLIIGKNIKMPYINVIICILALITIITTFPIVLNNISLINNL